MEKRFRVLRFLAIVYKLLGVVVFVAGIASSCWVTSLGFEELLGDAGAVVGNVGGALGVVTSVLAGLGLYAFGEALSLGVAIEENTRATAVRTEALLSDARAPRTMPAVSEPAPITAAAPEESESSATVLAEEEEPESG